MSEADNSTFEWTQDRSINLAEMLEDEPALWNKNHTDYKKGYVRHESLKRMADILGTTALVVQNKLNNIRSQFFREEKKVRAKTTGSSSSTNYVSKWFLFDHLQFLKASIDIKDSPKESKSAVFTEEIVTMDEVNYNEEYDDRIFHHELTDVQVIPRSSQERALFRNDYQTRKTEDRELTKAVIALSNRLLKPPKEKEKEEDDCDIFGRLVAKRMRMIRDPIARLVTEQEISSCITKKICENPEAVMTPTSTPKSLD